MRVSIDDVKPGMVLSEDVLLPNGTILVNASHTLDEKLIEMLHKRQIEFLQIVNQDGDPEQKDEPTITETVHEPAAESEATEGEQVVQLETPEPLPKVMVRIADDGMSAAIRIDPVENCKTEIEAAFIVEQLEHNNVTFGIDEKAVNAAVANWNDKKSMVRVDNIAKGAEPTPGTQGAFTLKVSVVSENSDVTAIRKATHFWQVASLLGNVQPVDKGAIVAERDPDTPPVPGKKVTGEIITIDTMQPTPMDFDEGVTVSQDQRTATASVKGIPYFVKGHFGILELDFNGQPELKVSSDRMSAELVIHAPGPGGKLPDQRGIERLFTVHTINHGIQEDILKDLFANLTKGELPQEPVRVAEGQPPQPGENGKVEFFFDTTSTLEPKKNPDGSVDFKSLSIVHSVSEGDKLARLVAPTKGVAGKDITGQELPAKDGTDAVLPFGENTTEDPNDPAVLISTTDGNVRYNGKTVEVSEGFIVKGDVDFSTGNVNYAKSVIVQGDIKSGFDVTCGGNLEVTGTIEDSQVMVDGDVLCKHGFVGQGKGLVEAKGNVNIGFLKNQTIRSRQNVIVAKECINAAIFAKKSIVVHGKPLSVAGGNLVARDSITVYTVGNVSQIRTVLEVGLDFSLIEELEKTEKVLGEVSGNLKKLAESANKFKRLLIIKKKLPPKEEFLYNKLKNSISGFHQQMQQLEERKKLITSKMKSLDNAFIKIEHMAMPGSVFKIGERFFSVREEISGPKVIRAVQHQIKVF